MSEPVKPGDKINVLKLLIGSILYYFPCPSLIQIFKFKSLFTCFKTLDGNAVITESAFPLPVCEDQRKCEHLCFSSFHRLYSRCAGGRDLTALQAVIQVTPGPPSAKVETLGGHLSTPAELRLYPVTSAAEVVCRSDAGFHTKRCHSILVILASKTMLCPWVRMCSQDRKRWRWGCPHC